ncbi:MAG: Yip1 family protein [Methanolobus sp.]
MLEVITHPDSFFKRKMNEEIEIKIPLMIMGFMWLAGLLKVILVMFTFRDIMSAELLPMFITVVGIALLGSFIGIFAVWIIISGIFYVVSSIFRGKGSFKRVMEFFSYGFIPSTIEDFVITVYIVYIMLNMDFVNITQNFSEAEFVAVFLKLIIFSNPTITILLTVFSLIMTFSNLYIWIYGLKYSRNLSLKNAIIAVIVPVVLYTIYGWVSWIIYFIEMS